MSRKGSIGPRWLLALAALLLGALWVRSRSVTDAFAFFAGSEGRMQALGSAQGRLCVVFTNISFGRERSWTALVMAGEAPDVFVDQLDAGLLDVRPARPAWAPAAGSVPGGGLFGFSLATSQPGVLYPLLDSRVVYVTIPHWAAVALCGVPATWMLLGPGARRARRRSKGFCEHCGYDLRASSERCPECGAALPSLQSA